MRSIVVVILFAARLLAQSPIQHIVFIIKENHSFDNVFGTFPGANGATFGMCGISRVQLAHTADAPPNLKHEWTASHEAVDGGKMDGFCRVASNRAPYTQYNAADIPNYWAYAESFALADNMFSSLEGASFANHLYMAAATSNQFISNPTFVDRKQPDNVSWGCDAPEDALASRVPHPNKSHKAILQFPCLEATTLSDLLDNVGLTWHYYAGQQGTSGYLYSVFDSVPHIRNGSEWTTNITNTEDFVEDVLQNNTLANFTWITPRFGVSEHPPEGICNGENWTVQQVNAIMKSQFWNSTAIFITWDDWGGYYDHVAPPEVDFFGLGIRVPLLIISPYVKQGVVHTQYEFASVLKFAEQTFGLPTLTHRDAIANDLMDAFDFNQSPLNPLVLSMRSCPKGKLHTAEEMNDPDD